MRITEDAANTYEHIGVPEHAAALLDAIRDDDRLGEDAEAVMAVIVHWQAREGRANPMLDNLALGAGLAPDRVLLALDGLALGGYFDLLREFLPTRASARDVILYRLTHPR